MDSQNFNLGVNQIAVYTDWFIFGSLLLIELWVFISLRFKVDKSGILTLILHLSASILRIIRSSISGSQFLITASGIMIWISLHYFTFEMWFIKITLTSDSY